MRDEQIEAVAARHYDPGLPYHNFGHALETVAAGAEIVARCDLEGIRIDGEVVYCALLFHDAGYHENHRLMGFDCKEAYSAQLAVDALKGRLAVRALKKVHSAIMSTRREGSFRTAEQKAVRAADLSALASEYEIFQANTDKLWREYCLLSGEHIAWHVWCLRAMEVIRYYLGQEIRLTSYFAGSDGSSAFHRRAYANLERLRLEVDGAVEQQGRG